MSESTVTINAPKDVVWKALTTPTDWPAWWPEVNNVEPVEVAAPTTLTVGDVYDLNTEGLSSVFSAQRITVTSLDPGNRMAFTATSADGNFVFTYVLGQTADGLTVRQELDAIGIIGGLGSALTGGYQRRLAKEGAALRDHCEGSA